MTMNIFTKFCEDQTISCQIIAWTSHKILIFWPLNSKYDLDLFDRAVGPICDALTLDALKQFDIVLWSYNNNLPWSLTEGHGSYTRHEQFDKVLWSFIK